MFGYIYMTTWLHRWLLCWSCLCLYYCICYCCYCCCCYCFWHEAVMCWTWMLVYVWCVLDAVCSLLLWSVLHLLSGQTIWEEKPARDRPLDLDRGQDFILDSSNIAAQVQLTCSPQTGQTLTCFSTETN